MLGEVRVEASNMTVDRLVHGHRQSELVLSGADGAPHVFGEMLEQDPLVWRRRGGRAGRGSVGVVSAGSRAGGGAGRVEVLMEGLLDGGCGGCLGELELVEEGEVALVLEGELEYD